tara:strand:- start:863 stop:1237 length:375 start_codon:yes stop_codon:yes gene_type:complete
VANESGTDWRDHVSSKLSSSDPLDRCIEVWEEAIANYELAQLSYVAVESSFKAWEAAIKMAHMRNKASGVMAEGLVRTHNDWEPRYLESQTLSVKSETAKRILRISEAKWETERSKQVSLRNLK